MVSGAIARRVPAPYGLGMNPTKNSLQAKVRTQMAKLLNDRLADTIDLYNQMKQAHWNVKGEHFIALHQLFDSVAGHVLEWADELAERAVQLGGTAEGTTQAVGARTTMPEYPIHVVYGHEHVELVSSALAEYGKRVRTGIDAADKAGDKDTADLFTEISRGTDKDLWFVEAHLQRGA
jgi:starvation-inducible DNA-binding protein